MVLNQKEVDFAILVVNLSVPQTDVFSYLGFLLRGGGVILLFIRRFGDIML